MLRKFSVSGYKNFENTVTLDFTNVRDYKFNKDCIVNKLLGKVLLTGRNGSGKTNLAYALFDIVYTLTDKIHHPMQKDEGSFINGFSKSGEAQFTYEFQMKEHVIRYEYHKTAPFVLTYESMSLDDRLLFEFDYAQKTSRTERLKSIDADKLNVKKLNGTFPALRLIANNTMQTKSSPVSFVMDFVSRMLYFRSVQDGNTFIGLFDNTTSIEQYIINKGLVDDFQNFVNEMTDLNMKIGVFNGPGVKTLVREFPKKSLMFHPIASSGTSALELYYFWSRYFDKVSFLYVDEFDAYYHYELSEKIMRYTRDNVKCQTIFTSHNTSLVDNEIMRPDCCLRIENGKIASFADSTTRELREGHNIEKMLRNGAFDE